MKKAFLSLYGAFIARYLISFASLPFLSRVLGPKGLGVLAIATSLAAAITIVVEYGFGISALREVSSAEAEDRGGILAGVTVVKLTLLSLVALAFCASSLFIPAVSQFPASLALIVLLGGVQGLSLDWYFLGTGRATISAVTDVSGQAMWFIPVLFLVHSEADINRVLMCQLLAQFVLLIVAYAIALRKLRSFSVDWRKLIEHVKSSTPMFIFKAAGSVHAAAIALILGAMAGAAQVGYFNAADRFVGTLVNSFNPGTQALLPYVYKQTAQDGPDRMFVVARYILIGLLGVSIIYFLGAYFGANLVIHMFTGAQFTPSVQVLQILAITFPIIAVNYAFGLYVMLPLRLDGYFVAAVMVSQVISLGLTYLLAPAYGADGIALARVTMEGAVAVIFTVVLYRKGYLKKLLSQGPMRSTQPIKVQYYYAGAGIYRRI